MMMTRPWTDVLSSHTMSYNYSNWSHGHHSGSCGTWTHEENKLFEDALAEFDDTPDRWEKVASLIPGKTAMDVLNHYKELEEDVSEIEAGTITYPDYGPPLPLEPEFDGSFAFEGAKQAYYGVEKRAGGRGFDQERKKGIPWTEEEHKLFLLGLKKYGKGDWRNISRNFVTTRTPTQVASHAQKYFIRLNSGGKDKRRSSIHDITTENLPENKIPALTKPSVSPISSSAAMLALSGQFPVALDAKSSSEVASKFNQTAPGNQFMQTPCGINPYGLQSPHHTSENVNLHGSMVCSSDFLF